MSPDLPRRRLLIVLNPTAGRRRRGLLAAVLAALAERGAEVVVRETGRRGDAEAMARMALSQGFDALVVAGGDGTVNEAANGLDATLPLALVPLGTANVLAHEIGLPPSPQALAAAIVAGPAAPVCLGRVNGRRFTMMVGVGFDARVVARLDPRLKRWAGRFAYAATGLVQLATQRACLYDLTVDGVPARAAAAICAKGRHYAGPYVLAPEARLEEPALSVVLFERPGRLDVARYALAILRGRAAATPGVRVITAREVVIAAPEGEPVQADGDLVARLPVRIGVEPDAIRLIRPAS